VKKQQNNSTHAWGLHVALSIALLSISAVLLASIFKTTPVKRGLSALINPVAAADKDLAIAGPAGLLQANDAAPKNTTSNGISTGTCCTRSTARVDAAVRSAGISQLEERSEKNCGGRTARYVAGMELGGASRARKEVACRVLSYIPRKCKIIAETKPSCYSW